MTSFREAMQVAISYHQAGRFEQAESAYRQILQLQPDIPKVIHLLGVVAHQTGRYSQAIEYINRAITLNPGDADYYANLGAALRMQGRLDEATDVLRRALEIDPAHIEAWNTLGNVLQDQDNPLEAVECYRRVFYLAPSHFRAMNNLANALKKQGQPLEAIPLYYKAISLSPSYRDAYNNLANTYHTLGEREKSAQNYRKGLTFLPVDRPVHSDFLYTLNFSREDGAAILQEHLRWDALHARSLMDDAPMHANSPDPDRRLRVGYVSADFRTHSVAYFIEPVLAAHDPARVEVFCYASVARPDAATERLRCLAHHWRDIHDSEDEQVAALIRKDRIDILVDLAGHTGSNRLMIFAYRPSPVQVTYLGYPNTTGMAAMDYRITDARADPEGKSDSLHAEQLLRIPGSFLCYQPAATMPPVAALPAMKSGYITFGCFNNSTKITPEVIELWCRILKAVPESRLLIKANKLGYEDFQRHYREKFRVYGIDQQRLEMMGRVDSHESHMALYGRVDIALDPFPYNGTTTTCEALWMGVPVVTLAGNLHAGRVGVSILTTAGLTDWIAETPEQYLEIAVQNARHMESLGVLRSTLRGMLRRSPLLDREGMTRRLEATYRCIWKRWCSSNEGPLNRPSST